jgi:hypothetical protein
MQARPLNFPYLFLHKLWLSIFGKKKKRKRKKRSGCQYIVGGDTKTMALNCIIYSNNSDLGKIKLE